MRFRHTSIMFALVALFLIGPVRPARAADKPDPALLRGATTVFIPASVAEEDRTAIVEQLKKDLPAVSIVDTPEQASLVLSFSVTVGGRAPSRKKYVDTSDPSSPYFRPPAPYDGRSSNPSSRGLIPVEDNSAFPYRDKYLRYGLLVVERIGGERRALAYAHAQQILWSRKSVASGYAKRFVKAWKKANRKSA